MAMERIRRRNPKMPSGDQRRTGTRVRHGSLTPAYLVGIESASTWTLTSPTPVDMFVEQYTEAAVPSRAAVQVTPLHVVVRAVLPVRLR